jgi:hypothetical protein
MDTERINQPVSVCEVRRELREKLDQAFLQWGELQNIPEQKTAAEKAERRVSHLEHAYHSHVTKHGCSE